ncbi:hypothetical protein [Candidatus Poriferisodalis sp.]|uniref:hypothetical protein n=1 Tax=Candidatus Poriferisodalis sp. TaxID=3101277 RepID=UPI003C6FAA41
MASDYLKVPLRAVLTSSGQAHPPGALKAGEHSQQVRAADLGATNEARRMAQIQHTLDLMVRTGLS